MGREKQAVDNYKDYAVVHVNKWAILNDLKSAIFLTFEHSTLVP